MDPHTFKLFLFLFFSFFFYTLCPVAGNETKVEIVYFPCPRYPPRYKDWRVPQHFCEIEGWKKITDWLHSIGWTTLRAFAAVAYPCEVNESGGSMIIIKSKKAIITIFWEE